MNKISAESANRQKILGRKGLILFLVLLSAFVPLSTDLYLPALPTMTKYFNVPEVLTNLTIILFFVFYSLASLFWGPLSDKHGRRKILIIGLIGYTIASLLCAVSLNVYMLIVARVLQAIGAGAASATATAIIKDTYEGKKLESTIALIQSISVVCPVVAPVLGAQLLRFTDWRGSFFAQTILGVIVVVFSFLFTETIQEKMTGSIVKTMGRLFVVLKNKRFTALLLIFATSGITFMAYVSAATYIYQDYFGLSSQAFSYFFAFNAAIMFVGPLLYIALASRFSRFTLININFAVTVVAGILICSIGRLSPWLFAATLLPTTLMGSFIGPPSRFLMLSQQQGDSGSVSSLINAVGSITGSLGMTIVSFNLGNPVIVIGLLNVVMALVCGGAWILFTSRPFLKDLRG
jgi:DHA1 family bicyclomycin/chloramphenicol resistance-like MFS transporter